MMDIIMWKLQNNLLTAPNKKSKATAKLKLSAAGCGEASILKRNKGAILRSLTPRQAAGNVLAGEFIGTEVKMIFAYNIQWWWQQ